MTPKDPAHGHMTPEDATPEDLMAGGVLPEDILPEDAVPEDIDDVEDPDATGGEPPSAASPFRFVVPDELAGTRVDAGLAMLMDISRSQAAVLIAEGNVLSKN